MGYREVEMRSMRTARDSPQLLRISKKLKLGVARGCLFPYISFLRKGTAERRRCIYWDVV